MWVAVRPLLHREPLALAELKRTGHEVYAPRAIERRNVRGRRIDVTPLLFPSYIFCEIAEQWHAVRWCPGVAGLVMTAGVPAKVDDRIIAEIRERENRRGLIELARFKPGDRVRVVSGPLNGISGIFHRLPVSPGS